MLRVVFNYFDFFLKIFHCLKGDLFVIHYCHIVRRAFLLQSVFERSAVEDGLFVQRQSSKESLDLYQRSVYACIDPLTKFREQSITMFVTFISVLFQQQCLINEVNQDLITISDKLQNSFLT